MKFVNRLSAKLMYNNYVMYILTYIIITVIVLRRTVITHGSRHIIPKNREIF